MNSRPLNQTGNAQVPEVIVFLVSLIRTVPWQIVFSSLIALVGLGWGIWLRVLFFHSFPDSIPTPDTWTYVTGVYSLLENGQFDLFSLRTPGFPLLVWLVLFVFKSFAALNIMHSVLTLLSAFAIAYVVRAFGGQWRLPAALAVGFLAVNSHLLFWEHFIMTEGSFQAFFVLALVATALAILRPTSGRAAVAGVLVAVTILIRPQGLFLIPLVLLAIAWAGRGLGRRKLLWLMAATVIGPFLLLGGWSARNAAVHGFFGLSNVGPIVNFGVSARWVDLESPTLAEDKALIADSIRRYRSMPENFNWVAWSPEGPVTLLSKKYADNFVRRDQVLDALAREAILHHPMDFARSRLQNTYLLMTTDTDHGAYVFAASIHWEDSWKYLTDKNLPVNEHRAALDQKRFPMRERAISYNSDLRSALSWEMNFIRISLGLTLLAVLALPFLRGPQRLATAVAVISVILLILTAGFLCEPAERYLSVIHGSAALAGALAVTGLLERWVSRRGKQHQPVETNPGAEGLTG